ncbi:hemicentin-2-like isoform X2 [Phlebotomus argentipes]|uniref:hemicentin-2-like isoform X2 n=1 Tax=Phlebotomus argentipes TaxID=94469 RepID=UPI002893397B|nr:hemicentin-2-like isoform X2 [Phlebotomus argentipes]
MEFWKYALLCSLFVGLIAPGLAKPADSKDQSPDDDAYVNDDGDEYNNAYDDEENTSVDKSLNTEYNSVALEPVLELQETEVEVKPGEQARVVCRAKNLSKSTVLMWYFGDNLVSMGTNLLSSNDRIHLDPNNVAILIIDKVQQSDEGYYTCKILPQELTMKTKLTVSRSPTVRILDNGRDVSGGSMTYREGDKITLQCRPSGNPEPTVTWSSQGVRLERVNGVHVDQGKLVIERAEHHHARVYQCLADNSIGKPAHESVTINIHYTPKVTAHHHEVNTGEGYDAELSCNFKSDPAGRSTWLRDLAPLPEGGKYRVTQEAHGHHNKTTLLVRKVQKSDLGMYQCQVENRLGRGASNVSLIYEPEPAHFDGYELQTAHLVLLNWTVRSVQPLSEVLLYYQKSSDKQWTSVKPVGQNEHKDHSGVWLIQHRVQLSPGTWHARVKSRNTEGWSKYSESQIINVPMNSTETSGSWTLNTGFPSNLATILVASLLFCVRWT